MIYFEDAYRYGKSIGIIGQGFVGTAIRELLKSRGVKSPLTNDLIKDKCENWVPLERIIKCDYIFVCVPTPMKKSGECDTSILESVILDITSTLNNFRQKSEEDEIYFMHYPIVIIKSTVSPGTCQKLSEKFSYISDNIDIVFSPEFLTEANAVQDLMNADRVIWGVADPQKYREIFSHLNSLTDFMHGKETKRVFCDYATAEMSKYFINSFLACKVTFANQMYEIAQSLGLNYEDVANIASLDPRVGRSHLKVPGPDGDFSYGGHCLPKDLSALIYRGEEAGSNVDFLKSIRESNKRLRKNKDWEKMKGRAVSND